MNFTLAKFPKSEIEILVTLPFPEFEPHVKKAAVLISEEIDIEGFRKGKAPYDVVKNRVGESAIYERAAELAVRGTYPEIVREIQSGDSVSVEGATCRLPVILIGQPAITVTKLAPGNKFEYKIRSALLPRVTLPDYKAIARAAVKEQKIIEASSEEVVNALDWIRESRVQLITVGRPAGLGDRVEIDLEIRHGGVKIDGGDSKNHPTILGKGKFMPGLEDALIGMRIGEEKIFTLVVPDTWRDTTYAGKELAIKARMKLVQERKIPELTDEFAHTLGNFSSADALGENILKGIEIEKQTKEYERIRGLIIEGIAKEAIIDVPDVLVERELDTMSMELKNGIEGMGMKWEDYLLHVKKTQDTLREEWREEGTRRVRVALCLHEIANQEKIEPSEEEIKKAADEYLSRYKIGGQAEYGLDPVRSRIVEGAATTALGRSASNGVDPERLKEYTKGVVRNQKVFEFLEKQI